MKIRKVEIYKGESKSRTSELSSPITETREVIYLEDLKSVIAKLRKDQEFSYEKNWDLIDAEELEKKLGIK